MLKNSIRQLLRTRVRSILFFILITLCSFMICLGCNLVQQCHENMEKFKNVFVTIGTVEQKPVRYVKKARYDQAMKNYTYYTTKEYDHIFSLSELDMEGVHYISGPERRPFYSAYLPDYKLYDPNVGISNDTIIEASPVEDCIPAGPVKMMIKNVRFSVYKFNTETFYFCDHYNDHPDKLYADKTYIMCLMDSASHAFIIDHSVYDACEFIPIRGPFSEQTTKDGVKIPNVLGDISVEVIDDAFYKNGHDQYWDAYVNELKSLLHKVPVTATDDLNLMLSFYHGDISISQGMALEKVDFEQGNAVCLISDRFAKRNKIKIGDKITLPLRVADYALPSVMHWSLCPLNAKGENFEPFFTDDYVVKGIYSKMPSGGTDQGYSLDDNEIVIPRKSVKADDSNNIGCYGNHISPYNTSFRIPNGSIDEFMKCWERKNIDDVEIHFYDKGYSKLEDGIKQMESMARLLLIAGVVMTVLVLVFFCSMMINGQKKRTAIERSLGSTKWECMLSLLIGILLVAFIGCFIGCASGAFMTSKVADTITNQKIFDRTYSAGMIYSDVEAKQTMNGDWLMSAITFMATFGFTIIISAVCAWRNLKEEPLALLSGTEGEKG